MKPIHRAAAHFKKGHYEHVDRICGEILVTNPSEARAWQMRGLAALHLKRFESAATYLQEAVLLKETPQGFINLAVALLALDRPDDSARLLEKALTLDPGNAGAHLNLAACHARLHRYEAAEAAVEKALELSPNWPKATDMQARIALKRGNVERAFALATSALAADPSLSVSYRVLADIAMRQMNYELAEKHYQQSLKNNPDDPETQGNYALFLARSGAYEDAALWYTRAAEVLHDDAPIQHGLADALLIQGRLAEGWPRYSWRHLIENDRPLVDQLFLPNLPTGPSAVAVLDQGVGDQILMASMIPDLANRFPDLEVQCAPRLHTLFQRSFPSVRFTNGVHNSAPGVAVTPGSFGLADAGRWLRPDFNAFPHHRGYLTPDPNLQRELRSRYRRNSAPVVGISWGTRKSIKLGPHKSTALADWGPLLSMPGATFVNLQYESDPEEIAAAMQQFGARIISDPTIDPSGTLDSFAAQVAAMDLVITTSSAAAHMAGALNVPTWVLVPTGIGALWHWFLAREDSPWYPSVRLFRQTQRGEWSDVVERASLAFAEFMEAWPDQNS